MPHIGARVWPAQLAEPERLRVVAPNVVGLFRRQHLRRGVVAAKLALELGRPLNGSRPARKPWSAAARRGQWPVRGIGLLRDGTSSACVARMIGDAGVTAVGADPRGWARRAHGPRCVPHSQIAFDVGIVVTNTTPIGAYRGAGRPSAAAFLERIVDMAADELEIDPAEIRRRIHPARGVPLTTVMGATTTAATTRARLNEALRIADYTAAPSRAGRAGRRASSAARHRSVCLSEVTGGGGNSPRSRCTDDGMITVKAGTLCPCQGHATTFSQIAADHSACRWSSPLRAIGNGLSTGGEPGALDPSSSGGPRCSQTSKLVVERPGSWWPKCSKQHRQKIVVTGDGRGRRGGVPSRRSSGRSLALASERGEPLLVQHDTAKAGSSFPFGAMSPS